MESNADGMLCCLFGHAALCGIAAVLFLLGGLVDRLMLPASWLYGYFERRIRNKSPSATATPARASNLSAFELAYIAGGWQRVLQAALAELVRDGALKLRDVDDGLLLQAVGKQSAGILPIERYVHRLVAKHARGVSVLALFTRKPPEGIDDLRRSLQEQGMLQSDECLNRQRTVHLCWLILLSLVALCCSLFVPIDARIWYVLAVAVQAAIVAWVTLAAEPKASLEGTQTLEILRQQHALLRKRAKSLGNPGDGLKMNLLRGEVALAVALFGVESCTSAREELRRISDEGIRNLREEVNAGP